MLLESWTRLGPEAQTIDHAEMPGILTQDLTLLIGDIAGKIKTFANKRPQYNEDQSWLSYEIMEKVSD